MDSIAQVLLGILSLLVATLLSVGSYAFGKRRGNGGTSDPAGVRSTDFWLRQFDGLIQAQVRCETKQKEVLERLDRLIEIMEEKHGS